MKIVLVDDSRATRLMIKRALRQAGFDESKIKECESGQQALDELKRMSYDVLLTDWSMPGMDGVALLQAIREARIAVRVGVLTARATPEVRQLAREHGASFVMSKPVSSDQIKAVLCPEEEVT